MWMAWVGRDELSWASTFIEFIRRVHWRVSVGLNFHRIHKKRFLASSRWLQLSRKSQEEVIVALPLASTFTKVTRRGHCCASVGLNFHKSRKKSPSACFRVLNLCNFHRKRPTDRPRISFYIKVKDIDYSNGISIKLHF